MKLGPQPLYLLRMNWPDAARRSAEKCPAIAVAVVKSSLRRPKANPGWSNGGGPGGSWRRIGTATSVYVNVPEQVADML
jgi:hypothetical protein